MQDESQKKQADDSTDQPKDKEPQSKEAIQNPEDVIPDPKIVEEMSEKLAKNKQPVPARPAYELPARVKRKLRSQAKIRNEDRSENDSEQDRRDSMAIVPVEDPQDGGTENMELQTTKASGKACHSIMILASLIVIVKKLCLKKAYQILLVVVPDIDWASVLYLLCISDSFLNASWLERSCQSADDTTLKSVDLLSYTESSKLSTILGILCPF